MIVEHRIVTGDEFMKFIGRPENSERLFELIGGEIVEVVSNGYSSELGAFMASLIGAWVYGRGLGRVTGADGGYEVFGEKYIPDVVFISKAKQPTPFRGAYNPTPPDLVVEVLSPSNNESKMRLKIVNFLSVGAVVWVLDPDSQTIEVYVPGKPTRVLGIGDTLDANVVLPGFTVEVRAIFALGEENQ
jgi:Uma2 family endonuclease